MPDHPSPRVERVDSPPDRRVTIYDEYEHGPRDFGRLSAAIKRVSWGAIFAGTVVAIVIQVLLNMAGLAVGLQTFNPASGGDSVQTLGTGQAIWTVIAALISLFVGGWVAGRLAGMPRRTDGGIHGLVVWGLTSLLTLYLVTTGVGRIVGGAVGLVGTGLEAAGTGIAAVAPEAARAVGLDDPNLEAIRQEARQLLRETRDPALQPENLEAEAEAAQRELEQRGQAAATAPGDAQAELEAAINRILGRAEGVASEVDREDLVNVLVARTDLSREEARQTVIRWERQAEQARQAIGSAAQDVQRTTVRAAEDATDFLGRVAMWAFFAMLLGAIAGVAGGMVGAPHDLPVDPAHPAYPAG